jgi:hypothetical protein
LSTPFGRREKKWGSGQPNVVFLSTGQGMGQDAVMISIHKDYGDFVKFYHNFRRDWGPELQNFDTFLISVKGSIQMKPFSFEYLIRAKKPTATA